MIRICCFIAVATLIWSCQDAPKNEKKEDATTQAAPAAGTSAYASISLDTLQMLWNTCNYVDFVFYDPALNFSVSQQDPNAIKATLQHIAADVPVIKGNCKPDGRIFFQVNGRNALEGDFFLNQNCGIYYLWYKDGGKTPYAANSMTNEGIGFFQNLFNQIKQGTQPQ